MKPHRRTLIPERSFSHLKLFSQFVGYAESGLRLRKSVRKTTQIQPTNPLKKGFRFSQLKLADSAPIAKKPSKKLTQAIEEIDRLKKEISSLISETASRSEQLNSQPASESSLPAQNSLPLPTQIPQLSQIDSTPPVSKVELSPSDEQRKHLVLDDFTGNRVDLFDQIEAFLLDQRSPHTQRSYGKDLQRYFRFVRSVQTHPELYPRVKSTKIDRQHLIAYKDQLLSEGLQHTTVDRHLATLRSFFRWLVDEGKIEKNPAEGVRFLNPKKLSTTQGFSDSEVLAVLKQPDLHTRVGSLHYAILMILFYCGLRRSEVCELRTSQLFEERGQKVLRLRGKGNTERMIVVVPAVWNALLHYFYISSRSLKTDAPLFTAVRGARSIPRPLDPSLIFYIVKKYAKLAGIQTRVSPHSCRATAISNARDHQVPDRAIQEFAGWASPDMITRYDKRRSAIEKSASLSIQYGDTEQMSGPGPRSVPSWTEKKGNA